MNMSHACMGPSHGIPITPAIHEQYPDEVKTAWVKFDGWWHDVAKPVARATMPEDVRGAMELILETPIPGHEGTTGADSCYMAGVCALTTD